jgi:hypothetical protein
MSLSYLVGLQSLEVETLLESDRGSESVLVYVSQTTRNEPRRSKAMIKPNRYLQSHCAARQAREIRLYKPCEIPIEASAYHCLGWEEATKSVVRKSSALQRWRVVWVVCTSNLVLDSPSSFTTILETVVAVCVRTNTFPDI